MAPGRSLSLCQLLLMDTRTVAFATTVTTYQRIHLLAINVRVCDKIPVNYASGKPLPAHVNHFTLMTAH